jgi:large conductance mechanosensitive channel
MYTEFIDFILKYNVIWVAVGLIVAAKVGELVKSLVDDLITPLLLNPALKKLKVDNIKQLSWWGILYGKLLAACIDFLIVAFLVFLVVKYVGINLSAT